MIAKLQRPRSESREVIHLLASCNHAACSSFITAVEYRVRILAYSFVIVFFGGGFLSIVGF
jgi:hypothetical protein